MIPSVGSFPIGLILDPIEQQLAVEITLFRTGVILKQVFSDCETSIERNIESGG